MAPQLLDNESGDIRKAKAQVGPRSGQYGWTRPSRHIELKGLPQHPKKLVCGGFLFNLGIQLLVNQER